MLKPAQLRSWALRWLVPVTGGAITFLSGIIDTPADVQSSDGLAALVLIGCLAPLPWRERWPILGLIGAVVATVVCSGLGYELNFGAPLLIAIHGVGRHRRDFARWLGVLTPVTLALIVALLDDGAVRQSELWLFTIVAVGVYIVGWQSQVIEFERREHGQHQALLERRLTLRHERQRIAREFHDIVSHAIGAVVIQAAAARDQGPTLLRIEEAGRRAMTELRQMLKLLRDDDEADLGPSPGLAQLGELVEQTCELGIDVELRDEAPPNAMSPAFELAVYRIVQESLTNVVRHAHARRALVQLQWRTQYLALEITDDGRGVDDGRVVEASGRGLLGMRERAALFAGDFVSGPAPGGGFRVAVRLRYPGVHGP